MTGAIVFRSVGVLRVRVSLNGPTQLNQNLNKNGPVMPRSFEKALLFSLFSGAVILMVLVLYIGGPPSARFLRSAMSRDDFNVEEFEWFARTRSLILQNYVEEVDSRRLTYSALKGMVASLDDYSTFYFPEDEEGFQEKTKGERVGIGVRLALFDDRMVVRFPIPASPADKAGLRPWDRIVSIDGKATDGIGYAEGRALLRGPEGSTCRVVFIRGETTERRTVTIDRAMAVHPTVFGSRLIDRPHVDGTKSIGYLRISGFNKGTAEEITDTITSLQRDGATALIVDLRFNSGGLLEEALDSANLFVGEGVLLHTRGRSTESTKVYRAQSALLRFPQIALVLLVNGSTASAAEVFAGTLQDHKRAVLLGARTYGKGVVQSAITEHFGDDVVIKLTTARYYTPLGRCIDKRFTDGDAGSDGLEPDFTIPTASRDLKKLKTFLREREIPNAWLETWLGSEHQDEIKDVQLEKALALHAGERVLCPLPSSSEK